MQTTSRLFRGRRSRNRRNKHWIDHKEIAELSIRLPRDGDQKQARGRRFTELSKDGNKLRNKDNCGTVQKHHTLFMSKWLLLFNILLLHCWHHCYWSLSVSNVCVPLCPWNLAEAWILFRTSQLEWHLTISGQKPGMSCGHRVAYRQGGSSCFSKAPDQNLCCELPPLFQSQDKHPKHFLFSGNLNIGTTLVIKSPQRLTKGWVLLTCQSPGHFSAYNLLF